MTPPSPSSTHGSNFKHFNVPCHLTAHHHFYLSFASDCVVVPTLRLSPRVHAHSSTGLDLLQQWWTDPVRQCVSTWRCGGLLCSAGLLGFRSAVLWVFNVHLLPPTRLLEFLRSTGQRERAAGARQVIGSLGMVPSVGGEGMRMM